MNLFPVPEDRKVRLILSTDAKNEADDQFAIAYALLSPLIEVVGILAAHFEKKDTKPVNSVRQSYDEILLVLEKMGLSGKVPVLTGAPGGMVDENTPRESQAASFIIEESRRKGPPLYIAVIGAITDVASAYLINPGLEKRVEACIWIGGGPLPIGGDEFNLRNDIHAANPLLRSKMPFWMIPISASVCLRVGVAELMIRVSLHGNIGKYLVEQLIEVNKNEKASNFENRILWDMAAIGVILDPHQLQFHVVDAPVFDSEMRYIWDTGNRPIRIYDRVEPRYVLEDFYAKLTLAYG
jgi:inosine-uridine nucleoside N-ribohydrolase